MTLRVRCGMLIMALGLLSVNASADESQIPANHELCTEVSSIFCWDEFGAVLGSPGHADPGSDCKKVQPKRSTTISGESDRSVDLETQKPCQG